VIVTSDNPRGENRRRSSTRSLKGIPASNGIARDRRPARSDRAAIAEAGMTT
jgi:UDP-N-acetylmuramyl tripeptide synthase